MGSYVCVCVGVCVCVCVRAFASCVLLYLFFMYKKEEFLCIIYSAYAIHCLDFISLYLDCHISSQPTEFLHSTLEVILRGFLCHFNPRLSRHPMWNEVIHSHGDSVDYTSTAHPATPEEGVPRLERSALGGGERSTDPI